jgi:hypothetical protein
MSSKLKNKYVIARKNAAAIQQQFLLERAKSRANNSSSDDSDLESERVAAKAQGLAQVGSYLPLPAISHDQVFHTALR